MLKKLIKLNLDDLLLYIGVECGLFLVIQIVVGCVMYFARPDTSNGPAGNAPTAEHPAGIVFH